MTNDYVPKKRKGPTKSQHKFCTKCDLEKPFIDFKKGLGRFGLHSWCILCVKTYAQMRHIDSYKLKSGQERKSQLTIGQIPPGLKHCRGCDQVKPADSEYFNKDARGKGGLNSRCSECTATKRRTSRLRVEFDKRSNAGRIASGLPPRSRKLAPTHRLCKTCSKSTPIEELAHPSGMSAYKNCLLCRDKRIKTLSERSLKGNDRRALKHKGLKKCCACRIIKPCNIEHFWHDSRKGFKSICKPCDNEYQRKRRRILKERGINRKPFSEAQKAKNRAHRKIWRANQKLINPLFKIAKNISRCIQQALKNLGHRKSSRTAEILGCSLEDFKKHLESLFQPGMNWDNYGKGPDKWNVDHYYPQSAAKTEEEVIKLNHYTNLRPMWEPENRDKRDKIPDDWNPLV